MRGGDWPRTCLWLRWGARRIRRASRRRSRLLQRQPLPGEKEEVEEWNRMTERERDLMMRKRVRWEMEILCGMKWFRRINSEESRGGYSVRAAGCIRSFRCGWFAKMPLWFGPVSKDVSGSWYYYVYFFIFFFFLSIGIPCGDRHRWIWMSRVLKGVLNGEVRFRPTWIWCRLICNLFCQIYPRQKQA